MPRPLRIWPLARLSQLLAITCLGTGAALVLGQSLLRLGPKPNPDTPRWALQSLRRLAPDPELRREASLLLAAQDSDHPAAVLRHLKGQAWGLDPLAAVVWKRQALAASALNDPSAAQLRWRALLKRFAQAPASADALYALGLHQPRLHQPLLERFAAHPAALAAALTMAEQAPPGSPQQRQAAVHLARWGVRWPGAAHQIARTCRQRHGLTATQRNQLATALASLGQASSAEACLQHQPASLATKLAIAQALLKGSSSDEQDGERQLLQLALQAPRSGEAKEAVALLSEGDSSFSLNALHQLPAALQASAPVQARRALQSGNSQAALAVLQRWPNDPASWELQWQLARKALLTRQWDTAARLLAGPSRRRQAEGLPPALAARQQFWLGYARVKQGKLAQGQALWRQLLRLHPEGYYGWRAAVQLNQGDLQLSPRQAPPLRQPNWMPLESGSNALDRLWRLGQVQEAWETWRLQQQGQTPHTAEGLLLEGRLRQGVGDTWIGLGQLEQASLRLSAQQCPRQRLLAMALATPRFTGIFENASHSSQIPATLLAAVAKQESRFSPSVQSPAGAVGLMQLMPGTASELARRPMGATALEDPRRNAELGGLYLRQLLRHWQGNPLLAIASYNAGPGAVAGWITPQLRLAPELWVEAIPYGETRLYVKKVLGNLWSFQQRRQPGC